MIYKICLILQFRRKIHTLLSKTRSRLISHFLKHCKPFVWGVQRCIKPFLQPFLLDLFHRFESFTIWFILILSLFLNLSTPLWWVWKQQARTYIIITYTRKKRYKINKKKREENYDLWKYEQEKTSKMKDMDKG